MEKGLPYIEPVFGKHAAHLSREQSRLEAIEYLTRGRVVLPGWGRHRSSKYAHLSYQVTEAA